MFSNIPRPVVTAIGKLYYLEWFFAEWRMIGDDQYIPDWWKVIVVRFHDEIMMLVFWVPYIHWRRTTRQDGGDSKKFNSMHRHAHAQVVDNTIDDCRQRGRAVDHEPPETEDVSVCRQTTKTCR